jgi:hypothetical protein
VSDSKKRFCLIHKSTQKNYIKITTYGPNIGNLSKQGKQKATNEEENPIAVLFDLGVGIPMPSAASFKIN